MILDDQVGWTPWGTVIGAALGLIGGLAHLIAILNRPKNGGSPRQPRVES